MKKIIIFSFLALAFLASCTEKSIIDNAEQVGISKITYYPILTVKGDPYVFLASGTAFTDPGVTAVAGSALKRKRPRARQLRRCASLVLRVRQQLQRSKPLQRVLKND